MTNLPKTETFAQNGVHHFDRGPDLVESLSALDIANELLNRSGKAILNGDFRSFSRYIALPHTIETYDSRVLWHDEANARRSFDDFRHYMSEMGITDYVRYCLNAQYRDARTISSTHECRLLRGAELVTPAYPVHCIIRRGPQGWAVQSASYALPPSTQSHGKIDRAFTPDTTAQR